MVKPLHRLLAVFFLALALALSLPAQAEDGYQLGRGLHLPGGLTLGGYANLDVIAPHSGATHADLSDLSLFITWQASERWRFFSEVELEEGLNWVEGRGLGSDDAAIRLERLYGDYSLADTANVRVGKYLTPIGRWNVIHADPLVWTTSRPVITKRTFAQHSTGAMLFGDTPLLGHNLEYQFYASVLDDPLSHPKDADFGNAFGLRSTYGDPGRTQIGFSYANFRNDADSSRSPDPVHNLYGVDWFWSRQRYELSGEMVFRRANSSAAEDAWGLYAQGVAPLSEKLYAIARYEVYQADNHRPPSQLGIGGLAYKPLPPLVFKLEYGAGVHTTQETPVGLAASVSVLF